MKLPRLLHVFTGALVITMFAGSCLPNVEPVLGPIIVGTHIAHAQAATNPMSPTLNVGCIEHGPVFPAGSGANIAVSSEDDTDVVFLHVINHNNPFYSYYSISRASKHKSLKVEHPEESLEAQYENCYDHKPEVTSQPHVSEYVLRREVVDRMRRNPSARYHADPFTLSVNGNRYGNTIGVGCALSNDTVISLPGDPTATPPPAPFVIRSQSSTLLTWTDKKTGAYKTSVIDKGSTRLHDDWDKTGLRLKSLDSCSKDDILEMLVGMTQKGVYMYVDPYDIAEYTSSLPTPRPTRRPPASIGYLPALQQNRAR